MTLAARMSSEKVALMLAAGPTSPPSRGKVLMTLGASVSVFSSSKEPMSQLAVPSSSPSWGLCTPRWSVSGEGRPVGSPSAGRTGVHGRAVGSEAVGGGGTSVGARRGRAWGL